MLGVSLEVECENLEVGKSTLIRYMFDMVLGIRREIGARCRRPQGSQFSGPIGVGRLVKVAGQIYFDHEEREDSNTPAGG